MSKVLVFARTTLLASAFGFALSTLPASAQQIDSTGDAATAEMVTVTPPNIVYERHTIDLPGDVSMSQDVSSDGIDLSTHAGAQAFRMRVSDTARDVCNALRDADSLKQQPMEHCLANAESDAMVRADAAIRDARTNR